MDGMQSNSPENKDKDNFYDKLHKIHKTMVKMLKKSNEDKVHK